jgi:hypothetical protein
LIAIGLAACGGTRPPPGPPTTPPPDLAPARRVAPPELACPIDVPGTSVTVEDARDGAMMVFVTAGDAIALRAQVFAIADRHNHVFARVGRDDEPVHASGAGPRRPPPVAAGDPRRDVVVLFPSTARVEPVERGARLVFASDVSERDALRAEVRGEAAAIADACAWR